MHLREGEKILKLYHHHYTPFLKLVIYLILGALPFYVFLYLFHRALSPTWFWGIALVILFFFILAVIYVSLTYWLDRLVVTNYRVVYIDYQYLTVRKETELLINDIQEIVTQEKGLLSFFRFLDYGFVELDTPASNVPLHFPDAPDPEGIRRFIYSLKGQ